MSLIAHTRKPGRAPPGKGPPPQAPLPDQATTVEVHPYYFHTDHLGTPQKLSDSTQHLAWDAVYAPFGEVTLHTERVMQPLRFPGQYEDSEMGLHQNWYRDYDPSLGRYLESDPIGLDGGLNTYLYVNANPLRFTDPRGLATYICRRPLGGRPGEITPPLLNHEYVCVGQPENAQCGSTTASEEGVARNIRKGSPGKATTSETDYYHPRACDKELDDDSCIESCIRTKLAGPRPFYAVGPKGTDCQEYTKDIVSACRRLCLR